jgi:hypothetical protein
MSYINSVYTSNPPQDATFTLSIGGYQVYNKNDNPFMYDDLLYVQ